MAVLRRRVRALVAVAALTLSALLIGGPSAIAQPTRPAVQNNIFFPGLNHFFAKPRTPPLEPLLRFYMLEYTASYPQAFRGLICLHKFRHLPGSKARRVYPCARVTFADLASPGSSVTWHIGETPYSTWLCTIGKFFVSFSFHAVSSSGKPQSEIMYSPFHKGTRLGNSDWGSLPPDRREAHKQTSCKKVKGS